MNNARALYHLGHVALGVHVQSLYMATGSEYCRETHQTCPKAADDRDVLFNLCRTRQTGSHRCLDRTAVLGTERRCVPRGQALLRVAGGLVALQAHVPVLPAVRIRGDALYLGVCQTSAGRRP